jgi:phage/plasmid-associated DNA primase
MNPVLPYLLAKDEHGEAILAWVVAGAMRWWDEYASKDRKMEVPDVVTREIFGMQEQTDELADFRETLIFDPDAVTTRADMHQYYLGWCEHVGTKMPKRPRQFGPLLRSSLEGYDVSDGERTVNGKRERCWIGVRF